jgi:hypothetical protein
MQPSIFLAQLIGPTLLVMGIGMIVNGDVYRTMAQEFIASRAFVFIAGILAFLPGLAIVLTHNVWVAGWPVIITIFGWLSVVGGVFRVVFPDSVRSIGGAMLEKKGMFTVSGVVTGLLGAWLCYVGYMS